MEFSDVIGLRRSIRKYTGEEVQDGQISELLQAARQAPSGLNVQPWRFIVVKGAAARSLVAAAASSPFVAAAPVILLCCADRTAFGSVGTRIQELENAGVFSAVASERLATGDFFQSTAAGEQWLRTNLAMNTAIAITHILLKAIDLGLGSCWVGMFDEEKLKAIAGLDERYIVTAMVTIGHMNEQPGPRPRLPAEELLLKVL